MSRLGRVLLGAALVAVRLGVAARAWERGRLVAARPSDDGGA